MIKLSAVIITLNEEKNIGRCIASLQGIADEVLVVDSLSTDRTEEICRELNVRFVKQAFLGYIEQKNFALGLAAYDHVLSLDADEALSDELRGSIREVLSAWNADGYYFNRLTNYCGQWIRHGGWYPDRKLRLVDRRKASWQGTNPHDKLMMQKDSKTLFLEGDLLHYSYYSIDQHVAQVNHFSTIKAKVMFDSGQGSSCWKMMASPCFKFFKTYFLKLGFLDGVFGYIIARNSAHSTFLKYAKVRALQREARKTGSG